MLADLAEGFTSVTGRICVVSAPKDPLAAPVPRSRARAHALAAIPPSPQVLFLDVLAFSIVIPILPNLILQMCDGDAGQAAFLQGMASSLDGLLKFFMQVRVEGTACCETEHSLA